MKFWLFILSLATRSRRSFHNRASQVTLTNECQQYSPTFRIVTSQGTAYRLSRVSQTLAFINTSSVVRSTEVSIATYFSAMPKSPFWSGAAVTI
jgi:hypothetical protein